MTQLVDSMRSTIRNKINDSIASISSVVSPVSTGSLNGIDMHAASHTTFASVEAPPGLHHQPLHPCARL